MITSQGEAFDEEDNDWDEKDDKREPDDEDEHLVLATTGF